jgi:uncharacterized RDD family membrane protein YckC
MANVEHHPIRATRLAPMSTHEFATITADDLVTGEAVALDLPPAGLGIRMASGCIDILATAAVFVFVVFLFATAASQSNDALVAAASVGSTIVVFLVFPATLETLTRGRSLGKLACGLRTVRDDAGPITFQHAFTRALIGLVEIYALTGVPAFFSALVNARGKRLGDFAAGTYVVRERFRLVLPPPPQMPYELAAWARSADMAALPTGLMLGVRQYLGRLNTLDVAARERIGVELAEQVAGYIAPPAPAGTPPPAYLAAVIASRRERDRARLEREAALRHRLTQSRR